MATLELDLPATRRANTRAGVRGISIVAVATERLTARWVALATVVSWSGYTAVGAWMVHGLDYMVSDAVSRTLSAELMVLSRDPHLAAVGFYWMPLPTVTRIPFVVLLEPFGQTLLAGPMTSGLFAAATIPVLLAIGREVSTRRTVAILVAAAYALNPVTVYIAANGMSESTFGFFLSLVVLTFLRWRRSVDSRDLLLFGLALAGCLACRYETVVMLPALLVGVALSVPVARRRSTVTLVAVPSVALFTGWAFVSKLITGDWLFWYSASRPTTATPPGAQWLPDDLNLATASRHVVTLVLAYAPALVPAGIAALLLRRQAATSVMLFGAASLLPAVLIWQLADGSSWMVPRFLVHTPLLATMIVVVVHGEGSARLHGVAEFASVRVPVARIFAWFAVALVPVAAVTSTVYLADPDRSHAEGEYLMIAGLLGRDDPRAIADLDTSNEVFIPDLDPYRRLRDDLDDRLADGGLVVMDSLQAVPVVLSEHPGRFIVPEDRDFEEILSDPVGRFDLIVVLPGRSPTQFSEAISAELERAAADGGTWVEVADYDGVAVLYEFEATGARAESSP